MHASLNHNLAEARAQFERMARSMPHVCATALTWTAKDVVEEEKREMNAVFDRPVKWTTNSLWVEMATARKLEARVNFRQFAPKGTPADKYLKSHVFGGAKYRQRFERALEARGIISASESVVPSFAAKRNSQGNWSPGQIKQILTQLNADRDTTQNETERSRKRAGTRRMRYFVPKPGSNRTRGVWVERPNGSLGLVAAFVPIVSNTQRFDFHDVARRSARERFPFQFQRAFRHIGSRRVA